MRYIKKIIKLTIKKIFLFFWNLVKSRRRDIVRVTLPEFANRPKNLFIDLPRKIINPEKIFIGDNVSLGPNCFLYVKTSFHEPKAPKKEQRERRQQFDPIISIGNRVRCNRELQIAAMDKIVIEDDVIIAANVFMSDGSHGYRTADEPYRYQLMDNIKPITVKRGCWLGKNVVIMPGVTIGENTIIGANSVVTKSIGPKCIAAGNPAKVLKKWDEKSRSWIKVDNKKLN